MDTETLRAFLTPFLPALLNLKESPSDTANWQQAQAIWQWLGPQVAAKAAAQEAALDAAEHPKDEDCQGAFRRQLKKILAQDAALASQIDQILRDRTKFPTGDRIVQNVQGNNNQVIGTMSGGYAFGHVGGSVVMGSGANPAANSEPAETASQETIKTILVLAANPKGTSPLRLGEEVRRIQDGLARSQHRDRFRIEQRWAVTPTDVRRALLDCRPQIVHFSGHGVGTSQSGPNDTREISLDWESIPEAQQPQPEGLLFEDETGQPKQVSAAALASLFDLFKKNIECVVLNACYSVTQAEAIAQHIPYVVGMRQAIGDRAAIDFAVGFYDALLAGEPVEFAYKLGCNAIELQGIPEQLTPALLQNGHSKPCI